MALKSFPFFEINTLSAKSRDVRVTVTKIMAETYVKTIAEGKRENDFLQMMAKMTFYSS